MMKLKPEKVFITIRQITTCITKWNQIFFLTIREPYIHNVKTHPMKIEVLTLFLFAYCVISDRTNMATMLSTFHLKILKMISQP